MRATEKEKRCAQCGRKYGRPVRHDLCSLECLVAVENAQPKTQEPEYPLMRATLETVAVVALTPVVWLAGIAWAILGELQHPGQEWDSHPSGGWKCRHDCPCKKQRAMR